MAAAKPKRQRLVLALAALAVLAIAGVIAAFALSGPERKARARKKSQSPYLTS